jgi:hypothetical protein
MCMQRSVERSQQRLHMPHHRIVRHLRQRGRVARPRTAIANVVAIVVPKYLNFVFVLYLYLYLRAT